MTSSALKEANDPRCRADASVGFSFWFGFSAFSVCFLSSSARLRWLLHCCCCSIRGQSIGRLVMLIYAGQEEQEKASLFSSFPPPAAAANDTEIVCVRNQFDCCLFLLTLMATHQWFAAELAALSHSFSHTQFIRSWNILKYINKFLLAKGRAQKNSS